MEPIISFLATVVLVSLIIPKLGPFLSLVLAAIGFGLMTGMDAQLMGLISTGLSRVFSSLAIVVFSGAILAEHLRRTDGLKRIVADLRSLADRSQLVSGLAGYIISLPVMCSITAFMILEPLVSGLTGEKANSRRRALFMTAACSVISFNLIYPSPVMITLTSELSVNPAGLLKFCIPISLLLFALAYLLLKYLFPGSDGTTERRAPPEMRRIRAWGPLILPLVLMLAAAHTDGSSILADPGIALFVGALFSLALERGMAHELIHVASRRSGVILLDLCGAGAFGYVVMNSGIGGEIYRLGGSLPPLLLPFLLSSILQFAQGSRVVTVAVSAQILAGYPLPPETLALLISSGAFMLSYVSDPYFWLIKSSTGASMKEMIAGYTLPLSLLGLASLAMTIIFWPSL